MLLLAVQGMRNRLRAAFEHGVVSVCGMAHRGTRELSCEGIMVGTKDTIPASVAPVCFAQG
jgi:hypothetical protein